MKTIYLNQNEFESLVEKKYLVQKTSSGKKTKGKDYELLIDTDKKSKTGNPIFVSNLMRILLPSSELIPQLITLYGIPAGLMESAGSLETSEKASKIRKQKKATDFTDTDLFFRTFRRALLYSNAWAVKSLYVEQVHKAANKLFTASANQLLAAWVTELVRFGRYPELKPQLKNIDDTLYDYQLMGMGSFLRSYFFPDSEKMENTHRDWLLQKLNYADTGDAPEKFKGYEAIFGGYLIALKAANSDQKNTQFIIEKAGKFKFDNPDDIYTMILAALFFCGVFESKADQYYYAAAASELFVAIDCFAWKITQLDFAVYDFGNAYHKVLNGILNPIENAVQYFKIKNPSIAAADFDEFEKTAMLPANDKIYIIRPEDSLAFVKKKGCLVNVRNYLSNNIPVTCDAEQYYSYLQKKLPAVLHRKGGILEASVVITPASRFVPETNVLERWLKKYFGIPEQNITENTNEFQKRWVLITENYQINTTDLFYLKKLYNTTEPDKITVFNFVGRSTLQKNMKAKNTTNNLFETELNYRFSAQPHANASNATLQGKLETAFINSSCRVISKFDDEAPWEMVLLGTGVLRDTDFSECTLFDLRANTYDNTVFEVILRCFRDLIVYDENQRYMFMNLS